MVPSLLFAVHISDGILAAPWWLGGIGLTVLLAVVGAWRIRDEEIPRIALLTSAFFVASLIHVRVGPTSAHLLLNGLMGVILGWRAALAIPIAVGLQFLLFIHGGYTTIGINSLVMTLPAILAYYLFGMIRRTPWINRPWFQAVLVGASSLAFILSSIFSVALLINGYSDQSPAALELARDVAFHPIALVIAGLVSLLAIWAEKKLGNAPEFPLGLLVGELTVLATVALNCFVLLEGGEANWTVPVLILVVAHLPIAVIEGIVMGFTVGLLARVRPDMLGMCTTSKPHSAVSSPQPPVGNNGVVQAHSVKACNLQSAIRNSKSGILAILFLFGLVGPAQAHRLEGEYKILPGQKVRVESWFDLTGDSPADASVQVFRANGEVLAKGTLDKDGFFVFSFSRAEPLRVVIAAGAGHRKELTIPLTELARDLTGSSNAPQDPPPPADRSSRINIKDVVLGIGFVLALAAFFLSWRNARQLRSFREQKTQ